MTLLPASGDRPEPVLDAAKLAAAVSGVVLSIGALLVLVGWTTADEVQNWAVVAGGIVTAIGTLVAIAMPIITALGARAQVTPLAAPVSVDGIRLVTSAAAAAPRSEPREITDDLRDLERADATTGPVLWPATAPISAVGAWTPATPAAAAAEPTPIAVEAEAASTGRIPPVSTPTT